MKKAFTEHPQSVGESYIEHMGTAFGFGIKMILSGIACLIHGLFPFLFTMTGRNCINTLHDRMVVNRCKAPSQPLADPMGEPLVPFNSADRNPRAPAE